MSKTTTAKAAKAAKPAATADKSAASDLHKADRASVLSAIATADDLQGTALVAALRMTVTLGRTSREEVASAWPRCGSPDVYASWFNLGDKVQAIIGQKATLDAIDEAAKTGGGSGFAKARTALSAIVQQCKAEGVKTLKPAQARMAVKAAIVKAAAPKAPAKTGPVVRTVKAPDVAAAAVEAGGSHRNMASALRLMSQSAHRLPVAAGREEAHRAALAKLADAAEAWAVFLK